MSTSDISSILETIKKLVNEVNEDETVVKVDVSQINETTNLRKLNIDSLDMISFRFSLDEAFGMEITDEDFEEQQLAIVGNLIKYIQGKQKA